MSSLRPEQRERLHSGESALVKAPPQTSHPDVADVGFAGGQADRMPTRGELCRAAWRGDVEEMRRLIDAGANIEERDRVRKCRLGGEGGEAEKVWAAMRKWAQGGWRRYGWGCKFRGVKSFHARGLHDVSAAGMFAHSHQL